MARSQLVLTKQRGQASGLRDASCSHIPSQGSLSGAHGLQSSCVSMQAKHVSNVPAGCRFRPWEMVLVVYGFPTKVPAGQPLSCGGATGRIKTQCTATQCSWSLQVQALQFEWAWQHPMVSIAVREAASKMSQQAQRGVQGKVRQLVLLKGSTAWQLTGDC